MCLSLQGKGKILSLQGIVPCNVANLLNRKDTK